MQIEEGFRDVKSEHLGVGLNLHRSHCPKRIEVLLLIAALANYIIFLTGLQAREAGLEQRFQSNSLKDKRVLSLWRLGLEYWRNCTGFSRRGNLEKVEQGLRDEVCISRRRVWGRLFSDGIGLFWTIKKPACGRLLGDWLGLFLVNRASLQNVHPDLASGCGTWRESDLLCRCDLSLKKGRCANVGRSILIFLRNSQLGVWGRAIAERCSSCRRLRSAAKQS